MIKHAIVYKLHTPISVFYTMYEYKYIDGKLKYSLCDCSGNWTQFSSSYFPNIEKMVGWKPDRVRVLLKHEVTDEKD
jgi:hypothetical protein